MAGNLTALCVVAGSLARPLGGLVADRFGGVRSLAILYGVVAMLTFFVGQLPAVPWVTLSLFLMMAALGMGNGAVFQLVPQRFQREIGVVTGVVGAAGGIGGFLLPFLFGVLKDLSGSYAAGFMLIGLTAFGCGCLVLYRQRDWRRHWAGEEAGALI